MKKNLYSKQKRSSSVVAAPTNSVSNPNSIKDNLLRWCQTNTEGYAVSVF